MLIVGNSHVSVFEDGIHCDLERVHVRWMGALRAQQLFDGHPCGKGVRDAIASEDGWVFLVAGHHDVLDAWRSGQTSWRAHLSRTVGLFERFFAEMSGRGRIALVRMGRQNSFLDESPSAALEQRTLDREFWRMLSDAAERHCVVVLDPLGAHRDVDGEIPAWMLRRDGIHVDTSWARNILDGFAKVAGVTVRPSDGGGGRRPKDDTELGHFVTLLCSRLELPARSGIDASVVQEAIVELALQLASRHGGTPVIGPDTELFGSGVLDSLDMAELWETLHERFKQALRISVDLRDLATPRALAGHFSEAGSGPSREDVAILLEDAHVPELRDQVSECARRFAAEGAGMHELLCHVEMETLQDRHPYGFLNFLKALCDPDPLGAAASLDRSVSGDLNLPANAGQVAVAAETVAARYAPPSKRSVAFDPVREWAKAEKSLRALMMTSLRMDSVRVLDAWSDLIGPDYRLDLLLLDAFVESDPDRCWEILERMQRAWPWSADTEMIRARLHLARGDAGSARASLREVERLDPGHAGISEMKRILAAERGARTIKELMEQAEANLASGRVDDALSDLLEAECMSPDSRELIDAVAWMHVQRGNLSAAQNQYLKASRLWPNDPSTHANLAGILLRRNMVERAQSSLDTVLRLDPNHLDALLAKARTCGPDHPEGGALRYWRRFLACCPWNHPAREEAVEAIRRHESVSSRGRTLWESGRRVSGEDDLLKELAFRQIVRRVANLAVVGAHKYQEAELLDRLFPCLRSIILFEPIPSLNEELQSRFAADSRIRICDCAVSDEDGIATFHVTNNLASSSLLPLGKHKEIFPHVQEIGPISVRTRRLGAVLREQSQPNPDMLFIDVQGAEYKVLSGIDSSILDGVSIIYTEASTEPLYQGSRVLDDVKALLGGRFVFLGFAPLTNETPTHGNALFVRSDLVEEVFSSVQGSFAVDDGCARFVESMRCLRAKPEDPGLIARACSDFREATSASNPGLSKGTRRAAPIVSAIVSTYASERFIRGCLDDLLCQSLWAEGALEIVVVDTGSPQGESQIVSEYQAKHGEDRIRLVRTEDRRSMYAAWNLGIREAKGKYLTNANTDDRHRPDAFEVQARELDADDGIDLVYSDCAVSTVANQTWSENRRERVYRYPAYRPSDALLHFQFGIHPMWRKSVHRTIGEFDGELKAAGDWDFNLRFALAGLRARKIEQVLGLYYLAETTLSFAGGSMAGENDAIRAKFRTEDGIRRLLELDASEPLAGGKYADALWTFAKRSMSYRPGWAERAEMDAAFSEALARLGWRVMAESAANDPSRAPIEVGDGSVGGKLTAADAIGKATTLSEAGDAPKALEELNESRVNDPDHPDVIRTRARILAESGRMSAAQAEFLKATQLRPDDPDAHADLAGVLLLQERPERAETSLRKVLSLSPKNPNALLALGRICVFSGRVGEALGMFRTFLAVAAGHPSAEEVKRIVSEFDAAPKTEETKRIDGQARIVEASFSGDLAGFSFACAELVMQAGGSANALDGLEHYLQHLHRPPVGSESAIAHALLDGMKGLEIGASVHNPFGLNTRNVGHLSPNYVAEQIRFGGRWAPVDIVADASCIPIPDESEDFVVSSHVLEHPADVARALLEWFRVVRVGGVIYIIVPLPEASSMDKDKMPATWGHAFDDLALGAQAEWENEHGTPGDGHYHLLTLWSLHEICQGLFGSRCEVVVSQERDDKVGNGCAFAVRKVAGLDTSFPWMLQADGQELHIERYAQGDGRSILDLRQSEKVRHGLGDADLDDAARSAGLANWNAGYFVEPARGGLVPIVLAVDPRISAGLPAWFRSGAAQAMERLGTLGVDWRSTGNDDFSAMADEGCVGSLGGERWFGVLLSPAVITPRLLALIRRKMAEGFDALVVGADPFDSFDSRGVPVPGHIECTRVDLVVCRSDWWESVRGGFPECRSLAEVACALYRRGKTLPLYRNGHLLAVAGTLPEAGSTDDPFWESWIASNAKLGVPHKDYGIDMIRHLVSKHPQEILPAKKSRTRVLLVLHAFPPHSYAGVENYTFQFAKALQRAGADVTVFHLFDHERKVDPFLQESSFEGLRIVQMVGGYHKMQWDISDEFPTQISDLPKELLFDDFLTRERFDVVHFHHDIHMPMSLIAVARAKVKTLCGTLHDTWHLCSGIHMLDYTTGGLCKGPDSPGHCAECYLARLKTVVTADKRRLLETRLGARLESSLGMLAIFDHLATATDFLADVFHRNGVKRAIHVEQFGVDGPRRVESIPSQTTRFVFLGNIHELKNVFALAEAFKSVPGDISLTYHGKGDPDAINRLLMIIDGDPRIHYNGGYTPAALPELLAHADVLINPSLSETYSLVIREAFNAGIPVLASRVGGIPETLRSGFGGDLFDPNSIEDIARAIDRVSRNPSILEEWRSKIPHVKTMDEDALGWMNHYFAGTPAQEPSKKHEVGTRAPSTRSGSLRVLVCSHDHPLTGCGFIRILQYFLQDPGVQFYWSSEKEPGVQLYPDMHNYIGKKAEECFLENVVDEVDFVLVQRGFVANRQGMDRIRSCGKPWAYELDDLLWEDLPSANQAAPFFKDLSPFIVETLRDADAVFASTPEIGQAAEDIGAKDVHVIPNLLLDQIWKKCEVPSDEGRVVIGYAGSATHLGDLALVEKVLERISAAHGDRIAFRFFGCWTPRMAALPNASVAKFDGNYAAYSGTLASSGIHIALAPLEACRFNDAKSAIKWLEYSRCGIAGIYSDVAAYRSVVRDGENGFLAAGDDPDRWFECIDRLIRDKEMRARMATNAMREVDERFMLRQGRSILVDALSAVCEEKETARAVSAAPRGAKSHGRGILVGGGNDSRAGRVSTAIVEVVSSIRSRGVGKPIPSVAGSSRFESEGVSIVILVKDCLEYTRACLESIERFTPESHEIILVDNGSASETANWLKQWVAERPNAILVRNDDNRGFAGGNNLGFALAKGRHILMLNNDTVVTPGWLSRMLEVLRRHPECGAVGPVSNSISGPQLDRKAVYKDTNGMLAYAAERAARHAGESGEIIRAVGFCLLFRREVFDAVGGLDERFGKGNFEDDDFSIRVRHAGWVSRVALDSFVHHEGGATFKAHNIDYAKSLLGNWKLFLEKWGFPVDTPYEKGYPFPRNPPEGALNRIAPSHPSKDHELNATGRIYEPKKEGAAPVSTEFKTKSSLSSLIGSSTNKGRRSGGESKGTSSSMDELVEKIETAMGAKDLALVDNLSNRLIEIHPKEPTAWVVRSMTHRVCNRAGDAMKAARRAVEIAGTPESLFEMAQVHLMAGNDAAARKLAHKLEHEQAEWCKVRKAVYKAAGKPWPLQGLHAGRTKAKR